jgi:hypothetical protein
LDALGKVMILNHVADQQILVIDRIIGLDKRKRRLVVKILSLASYCLMRFGQQRHRLTVPVASLRAPTDPTLGCLQRTFRLAIPARMEDACASGQRCKGLYTEVYASLLSCRWQGVYWHICTGEADIPPIRFPTDGDGLGCALQRARPTHGQSPDLGQARKPLSSVVPLPNCLKVKLL